MKETKVYTGRRNGKHAELMQRLDKALKEQHFAFVFTKQELKDHDREKDKRIKELEQKVQELQELDNKRALRLYCVLYDMLEKQDPENVASRIDYLTGKDYSDICELYKTAKNIKQHDKELVAKVCEDIKDRAYENVGYHICECGKKFDIECVDFEDLCEVVAQIQKEFEDE